MAVTDCYVGEKSLSGQEMKDAESIGPLSNLAALSALCNSAELDASQGDVPIEKRNVFGDATDTAILRFSEGLASGNVAYFRACWQRVFELAFNSKNKYMMRLFSISRREGLNGTLDDTTFTDDNL